MNVEAVVLEAGEDVIAVAAGVAFLDRGHQAGDMAVGLVRLEVVGHADQADGAGVASATGPAMSVTCAPAADAASATANPMSAKIAVTSSVTWLTGWIVP